jgi:hypothetical protein
MVWNMFWIMVWIWYGIGYGMDSVRKEVIWCCIKVVRVNEISEGRKCNEISKCM